MNGYSVFILLVVGNLAVTTSSPFLVNQRQLPSIDGSRHNLLRFPHQELVGTSNHEAVNLRGGGSDDEDSEDELMGATKTALSVAVGLAALSIIAKQPLIQDFLTSIGMGSSTSIKEAKPLVLVKKAAKSPTATPPPPPPRPMNKSSLAKSNGVSNSIVVMKTVFSVALTALGLIGILYAAQTDTVTEFYATLGLPKQIYGISPVLYVTFWFLTFAASAVTDLVSGSMSTAFQQSLRPTEIPSAEWYASIVKPSWNPPGWVFAVMWLIVSKPTQFLALRQMFLTAVKSTTGKTVASSGGPNWPVLGLYCVHLALGNSWNDVFFGFQKIGLGLAVIVLFWTTLVASALLFYKETPVCILFACALLRGD